MTWHTVLQVVTISTTLYGNSIVSNAAFVSSNRVSIGINRRIGASLPLHVSAAPLPTLESLYTPPKLENFEQQHEIEIRTTPTRLINKNGKKKKSIPLMKRKKIKVELEEVERMRKATSSSSAITPPPKTTTPSSPTTPSSIETKKIKKTPRMIKVTDVNGIPSPALSIPFANEHFPKPLRSSSSSSSRATSTRRRTSYTKSKLLTRDEECLLASAIAELRRVTQIKNDLFLQQNATYHPSEKDWAEACDLSLLQLRRIVHEGKESQAKLLSMNSGLVAQIAKRYYRRGSSSILTLQDMIQEGNMGLIVAAERFDPGRGFKFATYAAWWVRQKILRSIADHSRLIRLPVHVHSMLTTIEKTRTAMTSEIGRHPTIPELAHKLNMPVEKLKLYTDANRHVLSLEKPLRQGKDPDSDKRTISDKIASSAPTPSDNAEVDFFKNDIRSVIDAVLSAKERDVIVWRYGLDDGNPRTIGEVGRRLGISGERVRLYEARAINKLRHPGRNYKLKEYVGSVEEGEEVVERTPEQIWSF